jgi:hypothetical protein
MHKTNNERKKDRRTVNGVRDTKTPKPISKGEALFQARKLLGIHAHVFRDGRGCCVGRYTKCRISFGEGQTWEATLTEARKNVEAAGGAK